MSAKTKDKNKPSFLRKMKHQDPQMFCFYSAENENASQWNERLMRLRK